MIFPDQSHINRIRDALWQKTDGASIMVGAGFSKSAKRARTDGEELPILNDVAKKISDELYPENISRNHPYVDGAVSLVEGFTKLTQEYEVARGRSVLHRFLQNLVRDNDLEPSDFHRRLLRLPWCDVFTTNWDTLLERTLSTVTERKYSVVRNKDELPLAARPRIFKLHGSFPAHFPLICTEEDYRMYPRDFAPFVNTVQQSLMESVFCLIGFSGNDPNFLHWSGWVRDNMGASAPKIYLAGWLDLPSHQRRVLEDRNVIPIDLAHHPNANKWPEHLRHQNATDWILHSLERARPYEVTDWPEPRTWRYTQILEILQPVVEVDSKTPMEEPSYTSKVQSGDLPEQVRQVSKVWAHNRSLYPGWLAAPASIRHTVNSNTDEWEPHILEALPHLKPEQRLKTIRELVWRREILLEPISSQLESAAQEILKTIDCRTRTIDGVTATGIEWSDVRKQWLEVALALVTAARHEFNQEVFQHRIEDLEDFRNDHPDVTQRINHEKCLWAVYSMDFEALTGLLRDWQTEHCDPFWMVRKANILAEINRIDVAVRLIERALMAIREIPPDIRSVAGPSREGWALWLASALEWTRYITNDTKESPDMSPFFRRWRELSSMKSNTLSEIREYADALRQETKRENAPSFDLAIHTRRGLSFSNAEYNRWVAARRAIRLSEVAGLPTHDLDILKLSADQLSTTEPEMAVRLILRTLNYDGDPTLKRILSRPHVAVIPADLANKLAHLCSSLIEYALPRISASSVGKRQFFWVERLRVAIEVLSRLTVRLEPNRVEEIVENALRYYKHDFVARERLLTDPIRNLLTRSWEALPKNRQTARVLDLLSTPIVGMDNFAATDSHYPDPGESLQENFNPPIRTCDNEYNWRKTIGFLLRALRAGGEARKRASLRIAPVVLENRLTELESSQAADALWIEEFKDPNDLPGETSLFDWTFMLFPEPTPGLAEQRFRQKWFVDAGDAQKTSVSLDDILWQVGLALERLESHGRPLHLSEYESSCLIENLDKWLDTPIPKVGPFSYLDNQLRATRQAILGLPFVFSRVEIPRSVGVKLFAKFETLRESGIPAYEIVSGLAAILPDRQEDVFSWMRIGLASDDEDTAKSATWGMHCWLNESSADASFIQVPPEDLVREIGVMVATRRKSALALSLQTAKWIIDKGSEKQKEVIFPLVLHGLEFLFEELRYDRKQDQDDYNNKQDQDDNNVPLLRWRSIQLASSMANSGFEDAPAVGRWLANVGSDPLPEVRNAKDFPFAHLKNEN